jgi:hypothetical protein
MNTYKVTLGNVQPRPGHRHDCAQAEVEITVQAEDAKHARAAVGRMAALDLAYLYESKTSPFQATVRLRLNPDLLGARSVRVDEVLS